MRLLIIDNYDSFTFNLVQIVDQIGICEYRIVKNDKLNSIDPLIFQKVLISPGPGIASEAGDLMSFMKKYYQSKSMLGICLGYEAIGELLGAKLSKLPQPLHGYQNKASQIKQTKLFQNIPKVFSIGHYHSWIFYEEDIPSNLEVIVKDEDGLPMAIQSVDYDLFGLQFHPESIMTDYGKEIIENWLKL